jgi:uncharacterized damage-inducible protein DinB
MAMVNEEEHLRYPIGKEADREIYNSLCGDALKFELLNEIKMLPAMLEFAIQNLGAAQLDTPYRPGGWSVHQLIHHIADSHMNAYIRFKLGLTEDNPVIKTYDEKEWAVLSDTAKLPVNISLTLLHALHARWYQLMVDMTPDQWERSVYHPDKKRQMLLSELLKTYAWHGLHHTAHITKFRERMKWN